MWHLAVDNYFGTLLKTRIWECKVLKIAGQKSMQSHKITKKHHHFRSDTRIRNRNSFILHSLHFFVQLPKNFPRVFSEYNVIYFVFCYQRSGSFGSGKSRIDRRIDCSSFRMAFLFSVEIGWKGLIGLMGCRRTPWNFLICIGGLDGSIFSFFSDRFIRPRYSRNGCRGSAEDGISFTIPEPGSTFPRESFKSLNSL